MRAKAARVARRRGYLRSHTLPERGKGGAEARRDTPQGRGGAGPGPTPDQCRRGMASSLAEMAGLLGGNAPAGFTHPARATPLGGGVPGLQALRFRPEPGTPVPHTPAGGILKAAERLRRKDYTSMPWKKTPATEAATAPQE